MQTSFERKPLEQVEAGALIVPVFEGGKEERFGAGDLLEAGEIAGKPLELLLLHHVAGVAATRVLLAGAGKAEKFDPAEMRKLAGAAVRHLKSKAVKSIAMALDPEHASADFASAAVEGAILGEYEPDRYKTDDGEKKSVDRFTVVAAGEDLEDAVTRGRIVAEAQNFARALVNEPANLLTPNKVAEAARSMASEYGLECQVLDSERMELLGMGALLGVARGSAEPPALVVIRYRPREGKSTSHLGLVGKGVTFDSGGISIKPADGMEKMKYDMAGGAAMLGAMRAIAQLKPAIAVTAFIPCVENMPGSRAQRPGDIVTAMSGKTIEVINTDAEGRLILADALTYARKQGHADGRRGGGPRAPQRGAVLQRRRHARARAGGGEIRGRAHVAHAARGRLQRLPQERVRGPGERRRTVGRRDYRRDVPEGIRRGHAVGAPGHCRNGMAGRIQAVPGQGAYGTAGSDAGTVGDGLGGQARTLGPRAGRRAPL
jgi:leucyl aminopeptidase